MLERLEKLTKSIYRKWKRTRRLGAGNHPDEESLACFLEDRLSVREKLALQKHLIGCDSCAEYISIQLKIQPHLSLEIPPALSEKALKLLIQDSKASLFEIIVRLKEKALEIIQTSGDVLVGQELVPAPVLRSRRISEFKEEVSVLKDLQQLRVQAKIQNKDKKSFNLTITVKDKLNQAIPKSLRITLMKEEIELESYMTDSGSGYFENIQPGEYMVEVSKLGQRVALIDLKVRP